MNIFKGFFNLHPRRMCLLIFRERRREEREKNQCERDIDWLPLVHAPKGDQICDLGMCPD